MIPACASSSPAFLMMYTANKSNKQGDNIQPWCTPFPIWNQTVVPCLVVTIASWPAYRFLRRQVRWSGIPISFRIFHSLLWSTVKGFGLVSKAEVDVFLELSHFFDDPTDAGNLISGSSTFSKSSLNIWKFTVHVLLKYAINTYCWKQFISDKYILLKYRDKYKIKNRKLNSLLKIENLKIRGYSSLLILLFNI